MNTLDHAEPYPWPYDGGLRAGLTAVVVAGADPRWTATVDAARALAERLDRWLDELRPLGVAVVHLQHRVPARVGRTAAGAAPGPGGLPPHAEDTVLEVAGIDGFYGSPLDRWLRSRGRRYLALCGFGLEGPVHSTMRSANDRGYECLLVRDLSGAWDATTASAALSTVCMSGGIFGAVGTSADLLGALARAGPD